MISCFHARQLLCPGDKMRPRASRGGVLLTNSIGLANAMGQQTNVPIQELPRCIYFQSSLQVRLNMITQIDCGRSPWEQQVLLQRRILMRPVGTMVVIVVSLGV
jgi:hypothetical protein